MRLIQLRNDIRRHSDEGAEGGRRPDAVLPPVPRRAEHAGHLPEIVAVKPLRPFPELVALATTSKGLCGKQLLQFLSKGCLRDAAVAHAEEFDVAMQWRVLPLAQRA